MDNDYIHMSNLEMHSSCQQSLEYENSMPCSFLRPPPKTAYDNKAPVLRCHYPRVTLSRSDFISEDFSYGLKRSF